MDFHSVHQSSMTPQHQASGDHFSAETESLAIEDPSENHDFQLQTLRVPQAAKLPCGKQIHPFLRYLAVNVNYDSFVSMVETLRKMEVEEDLKHFALCCLIIASGMKDETFLVHEFSMESQLEYCKGQSLQELQIPRELKGQDKDVLSDLESTVTRPSKGTPASLPLNAQPETSQLLPLPSSEPLHQKPKTEEVMSSEGAGKRPTPPLKGGDGKSKERKEKPIGSSSTHKGEGHSKGSPSTSTGGNDKGKKPDNSGTGQEARTTKKTLQRSNAFRKDDPEDPHPAAPSKHCSCSIL